jgi:hypothetical protein
MSPRRLTSLIPRPHQVIDVARRVIELAPGLPGRRHDRPEPFERYEPPAPAPPPPPPVKPKPRPEVAKPKPSKPRKPKEGKPKPGKAAKPKSEPKAKTEQARAAKEKAKAAKRRAAQPKRAPQGKPASGFPEPPGKDPGDVSGDREPHHALNNPVGDPDLTEYPDPYEKREDPRDQFDTGNTVDGGGEALKEEPRSEPGATSTSEPHPDADPEAQERQEKLKRERLDR